MTLCINESGTWRDASTVCVNESGTWRKVATGCINDSGTWRCFGFYSIANEPLGASVEGGYLICLASSVAWIVAPSSTEVTTDWYSRASAVSNAEASAACGDWFVPSIGQLQNPGYACRTYWDSYSSARYWSDTAKNATSAYRVEFPSGSFGDDFKGTPTFKVRAFRCVTY